VAAPLWKARANFISCFFCPWKEAATNTLVAAINEHLRERGCDDFKAFAPVAQSAKDDWTSLAVESLSRAYGDSEPEYSAEDLVP